MEIKKTYRRFREFGGFNLIRTYWRMGVAYHFLATSIITIFRCFDVKTAYRQATKPVIKILKSQYTPLLKKQKLFYNNQTLKHEHKKVIWTSWMQGLENAPELVKTCIYSQKHLMMDYDSIVITNENISQYVNIPVDIMEKYKRGIIPQAMFSDLLRLELLIQHGGIWMDASVLCTSLNFPPSILTSDLFMFQYRNNNTYAFEGVSSWFIIAKSNQTLLLILRDMLYQYWRDYNCAIYYYIFHVFLLWIFCEYPDKLKGMIRGHSNVAIELGRRMENGEPFDEEWFNDHIQRCCFHKISYRLTPKIKNDPNGYYQHITKNPLTC